MDIGVIGGGSVGLLVSNYLAKKHRITLYVRRREQQNKINSEQLQLLTLTKVEKKIRISVEIVNELQQKDLIIVCVKQAHIPNVIATLKTLDKKTPILFLQNGMGHISLMKQVEQPSYVGVVEHGAYRMSDNRVAHLGEGMIKVASITGSDEQLEFILEKLHHQIFPFERIDDWSGLLKRKLIINAVINPLTALFDVPNGHVVTNLHIQHLAKEICAETASVLSLDVEQSWKSIVITANNTSENTSSMRADIQHNRQTEIDAITGYILNENKSIQLLPYTTFVYHAILSMSDRKGV